MLEFVENATVDLTGIADASVGGLKLCLAASVVDTVKDALDEVPPEIISDLMETGICLAGGGAEVQALDRRLTDELHVRTWVAEDPMSCVARGAGMILEDLDHLSRLLVGLERGSTRHE